MKNLLIIILIIVSPIYADDYFNGLSHATSDDLDALTKNPAGLAVNRDLQLGLGTSENDTLNKVGIGLRYKEYGLLLIVDDSGKYEYLYGSGNYYSKNNIYFGQIYSSKKDLRSGLLYRPSKMFSYGLTHNYNITSKINQLNFGLAYRPLGNHITFKFDIFSKDLSKNIIGSYANVNFELSEGIEMAFGYRNYDKSGFFELGMSFTTSKISINSLGRSGKKSKPGISFRYSNQKQKSVKIPNNIQKRKVNKFNFVKIEFNHTLIEEPVKNNKGFSIGFSSLNPLSGFLGNNSNKYFQLKDLIRRINLIGSDENIDGIIIYLKELRGGFSKILDVKKALETLKDNGKKIIVYSEYITNSSYVIASLADEIYIPQLSGVDLKGLNIEVEFYKDLLDTLGITFEVEQISPYKTALDPFLRNSMSTEMKENMGQLFKDIYSSFVLAISEGRGWSVDKTNQIINSGPYREDEAIKAGLITNTMYPDEFDKYIKKYNNSQVKIISFKSIKEENQYSYDWYNKKDKIAVIYAVGGIQVGKSSRGTRGPSSVMGNETISRAIKTARLDNEVKGILLRIDSGGGSALASDLMWKEIYNTTVLDTNNLKPIVASMSSVAASGGYYIACQADKIIASPTTITGSIGVISGRPNFSGLKSKIGIHTERIKFGERSDYNSGNKLWNEDERKILRDGIEHVYGKFLKRVSDGRDELDSLGVHKVAIGKVWSGKKAKELKLVDEIGDFDDAINLTAMLSGLEKNQYKIDEYPKKNKIKGFSFGQNNTEILQRIQFSGSIEEIQKTLQNIPDFQNDRNQMVLPYRIIIR